MSEQQRKWLESMMNRYGSEEDVRAEMRRRQEKSMQNPNKQKGNYVGPFNRMTKQELKEISRKGGYAKHKKRTHKVQGDV